MLKSKTISEAGLARRRVIAEKKAVKALIRKYERQLLMLKALLK